MLNPSDFIEAEDDKRSSLAKAFHTIGEWFSSSEMSEQFSTEEQHDEEPEVDEEKLKALLEAQLQPFSVKLDNLEQKFASNSTETTDGNPEGGDTDEGLSNDVSKKFSVELEKQLSPMLEKLNGLETKFSELTQEAGDQRPDQSGGGDKGYMPV